MKRGKLRVIFVLLLTLACVPAVWAQRYGPWSPPTNIGAPVNTVLLEAQPFISKDGLRLYFTQLDACPTCSTGPQDIWVAHRDSADIPWNDSERIVTVRLPATVNSPGTVMEATASESTDGHFLFFVSNRPGGFGKHDIYMSHRRDKRVDSGEGGWEPAVNLGPAINSSAREQGPVLFEDEATGKTILYFNSNRFGSDDIFTSELEPDGTWSPVAPVVELNTPYDEQQPTLSRDGLEIYFVSNRLGSQIDPDGAVSADIWMSTRASTADPWSAPQPVAALNSRYWEGRAALSFDGTTIYFNSAHRTEDCQLRGQCNMSEAQDIWMATRKKLTGPPDHN